MRSSAWAYPFANIAHLFGLALLAGGIMAVDLRIVGLWKAIPLKAMHDSLTPFAIAGLLLFAVSGFLLTAADAKDLAKNPFFLAKLAVIAVAVVNALAFRRIAGARLAGWNEHVPVAARMSALFSLSLWSAAIICGRMIAY